MQGLDRVSCIYFGEGTAAQADFHPAMHMAMLWNLPVIFACVNNQYVELHHYREVTHLDDVLGSQLARQRRAGGVGELGAHRQLEKARAIPEDQEGPSIV